jgi:tRNA threonylcarbamoyladenosine dehydratase
MGKGIGNVLGTLSPNPIVHAYETEFYIAIAKWGLGVKPPNVPRKPYMKEIQPCYQRLAMLIGAESVAKLNRCSVAVVGLGGVGGICAEALARSGVGRLLLVDGDTVEETNINRQIVALSDTIGQNKALIMTGRIRSMNPKIQVEAYPVFFKDDEFLIPGLDYVVDAIDNVNDKVQLIKKCREYNVPVISSMGAGNKLDPMAFRVVPIENTSVDPLAKIMRKKLKDQGISGVKTVCSTEKPIVTGSATPGSFMPAVAAAGLLLAAEVIQDILISK